VPSYLKWIEERFPETAQFIFQKSLNLLQPTKGSLELVETRILIWRVILLWFVIKGTLYLVFFAQILLTKFEK
jgi:hypothetical protein